MKKRNVFKKVALLGATAAMVMGMATGTMAGINETTLTINSDNYVDCFVYCNSNDAGADTNVYASRYAESIYAYASVKFKAEHNITGHEITVGSDSDFVSDVGYNAYASAYISGNMNGFIGSEAIGSHEASVDDYTPVDITFSAYN